MRDSRSLRIIALLTASAVALAGCGTISPVAGPGGRYATPMGNAPVISNGTPYSSALNCLATYGQSYNVHAPRVAVGRIAD